MTEYREWKSRKTQKMCESHEAQWKDQIQLIKSQKKGEENRAEEILHMQRTF